ncbi:MAG: hypothetical protein ACFE88_16795 [Candidatus Hermodarchaeota archaeon]
MIKCSNCQAVYSYGRFIYHNCENNLICFGQIFEGQQKVYKWNCNTPLIHIGLMKPELRSIKSLIKNVPDIEPKESYLHEWNCDYSTRFSFTQENGHKYNTFHIYE